MLNFLQETWQVALERLTTAPCFDCDISIMTSQWRYTRALRQSNVVMHDKNIINTLKPRQNGCHFPDDIFKCIFLDENIWMSINISLKFVPKGPIKNIPALVQIMAWRQPGDKPLSEPVVVSLLPHICITQPQWFNWLTNRWVNARKM